ncbi:heavy-metal-associated domain-containing protein [Agromyces endophyticus]|uniref:heavy-metal-associated domain-containing protein n=1 Tax=Agromyces sp. H17E-10 TaxID=2932244 RepID=UPI001FD4A96E|nr:heavy-metal-associated domain-containing protein [Agromyces sp. H17E-10]UOQ87881.1 heavy-metal-associated domain-containing protein [Agromyces sp. H17E-10]
MTHSHAAMTVPEGATELQLTGEAGADASCSCCAIPDASTSSATSAVASDASLVSADYAVAGMTCGNCVSHVSAELAGIEGVEAVEVALVAGGVSTVTVRSTAPLTDAAVAAAVEEAGYEVVAR